ncbi:sporulation protein YtfJ [Salipaludibacillus keqinensis]|uniref:Sporulation protein YtfJ n=1 Tax=Salipaludibacillus keqinensis TaxID=2045207 RepID=A0A323TFV7_9BACI|nr:GerW family sporulation protein [Salipaludibacillus keqinensis]PYZ93761.1 sporulation protein YtfJ [Salipaludibacillus keqinensis]
MSEHPIQGLMKTAMENLKEMVDVNTIVGDPVETPDGSVILPVSKVGFGFAAGGSEFVLKNQNLHGPGQRSPEGEEKKHPFGGGSGGGVSITPIAFLVVSSHGVKMIHLDHQAHLYEKLMEFTPQVVEKIQQMLQSSNKGSRKGKDPRPNSNEQPFDF